MDSITGHDMLTFIERYDRVFVFLSAIFNITSVILILCLVLPKLQAIHFKLADAPTQNRELLLENRKNISIILERLKEKP